MHCMDESEQHQNPDVTLDVVFNTGEEVKARVNIRPFVFDCLRKANDLFQVVVFTASH